MSFREVTITDGLTVIVGDENSSRVDDLLEQLRKSVQKTCKHMQKECLSTSESGSHTCFIRWECQSCHLIWTDELLPAQYESLLEREFGEDFREEIP